MDRFFPLTHFPPVRWLSNSRHSTRLTIICGTILLSVYLALRISRLFTFREIATNPVVLLIIGIVTAAIFLRWPGLGLVFLIFGSLVVRFSLSTGTQTELHLGILVLAFLLGLWLLDVLVNKRSLAPSRTLLPSIALIISAILSFISGQLPWFLYANQASIFAQIGGLAVFLLSVSAFLLVANQLKDIVWLERITWIFLCIAGLFIASRFIPGLRSYANSLIVPSAIGSLFWVWLVVMSSSQSLFNRRLNLFWRFALGCLAAATLFVGIYLNYDWKSGWVPALAGLAAVMCIGLPRLRLPAVLIGAAVLLFSFTQVQDFLVGDEDYSLGTRLEAWRIMLDIVRVSPVLGFGPANHYTYTSLFPILGYSVEFNSHNNYLDILAQTGILGLASFLWLFWEIFRSGWNLLARTYNGFLHAYVVSCLGGVVGMLVAAMLGDWVIPFVYNVGLTGFRASILGWLFLGGLVAIENIVHHSDNLQRSKETG